MARQIEARLSAIKLAVELPGRLDVEARDGTPSGFGVTVAETALSADMLASYVCDAARNDAALAVQEFGFRADVVRCKPHVRMEEPDDPSTWAAHVAGVLLLEAADWAESTSPGPVADALLDGTPGPGLGKGRTLRFRPSDRRLAQPLYEVDLDPEVAWANAVSQRVAVARVVADPPGIPYSDTRTEPMAAPSCSLEGAP